MSVVSLLKFLQGSFLECGVGRECLGVWGACTHRPQRSSLNLWGLRGQPRPLQPAAPRQAGSLGERHSSPFIFPYMALKASFSPHLWPSTDERPCLIYDSPFSLLPGNWSGCGGPEVSVAFPDETSALLTPPHPSHPFPLTYFIFSW